MKTTILTVIALIALSCTASASTRFEECVNAKMLKWNGVSDIEQATTSTWNACKKELPFVVKCGTDSDCEEKNPERADAVAYLADMIEGAQR